MRSLLAFALGALCAYVLLLMAEQRKPEPVAGGWREPEDGIQPADPYVAAIVWNNAVS